MLSSYDVVRSICGPNRKDVRPMVKAIDIMGDLLFVQNIPIEKIKMTKDIYPEVAEQLSKTPATVARSIERMANYCWDEMCSDGKIKAYIGADRVDVPPPHEIIFYLAHYVYQHEPYYKVIRRMLTR